MKTKINLLMALLLFIGIGATAQEMKTESFKVYGNCGMCKSRIEKATNSVEGVTATEWDKETKMIKVTFDGENTDLKKINTAIAKVGHDTDMIKAEDAVYDALPACCLYDRPKVKKEVNNN